MYPVIVFEGVTGTRPFTKRIFFYGDDRVPPRDRRRDSTSTVLRLKKKERIKRFIGDEFRNKPLFTYYALC